MIAVMAIALFSIGCSREENELETELNVSSIEKTKEQNNKVEHNRHYFDGGGKKYGCTTMRYGNCLGTVIVMPDDNIAVNDLIVIIKRASHHEIKETFLNQYQFLQNLIPTPIIDKVVAGELNVSYKGKNEDQPTVDYLLFTNLNSELEVVIPLKH